MQIHYANVGSIANPQAKIISVHYIFSPPENLNFDCFGLQCRQINATQAYEFSTSVNFIGEYSKNSKILNVLLLFSAVIIIPQKILWKWQLQHKNRCFFKKNYDLCVIFYFIQFKR